MDEELESLLAPLSWEERAEIEADRLQEVADGLRDDLEMGRLPEFGSMLDRTGLAYNRESYFRQW